MAIFSALVSKWECNMKKKSKMFDCRTNRGMKFETDGCRVSQAQLETIVECIMGYLWTFGVPSYFWCNSGHLCENRFVTWNWWIIEQNGLEFSTLRTLRTVVQHIGGIVGLKSATVVIIFCCHSQSLTCLEKVMMQQKFFSCHTYCCHKTEHQGPWTSCFKKIVNLCILKVLDFKTCYLDFRTFWILRVNVTEISNMPAAATLTKHYLFTPC